MHPLTIRHASPWITPAMCVCILQTVSGVIASIVHQQTNCWGFVVVFRVGIWFNCVQMHLTQKMSAVIDYTEPFIALPQDPAGYKWKKVCAMSHYRKTLQMLVLKLPVSTCFLLSLWLRWDTLKAKMGPVLALYLYLDAMPAQHTYCL